MNAALLESPFDFLWINQRAGRVVHGDIFRLAIDMIQASPNGILPAFATGNNRADFFEPCAGHDFPDFIMTLFTRHDYDFTDGSRALKGAHRVSNHRFARDCGKQLIEPHSLAAAAGYDDGTDHGEHVKS
jgi:hypothetical protein